MIRKLRNIIAGAALALLAFVPTPSIASQGACVLPTTGTVSGLTLVQDINACIDAIMTNYSGASAPVNGTGGVSLTYQYWLKTGDKSLNVYDGANWLPMGWLDATNHIWQSPIGGGTATVASANPTTDLCSTNAQMVTISGTNTIASFSNTCVAGTLKPIKFTGVLTLTHNSTSMILPNNGNNITTAVGDTAIASYLGGSNWEIWGYQRADGTALSTSSIFTGAVFLNAPISVTLGVSTDDWNPAGLSTANVIRLTCSAVININGIVAPATDGKELVIENVGATNNCTFVNQAGTSTAANRFAFTNGHTLRPGQSFTIKYGTNISRWTATIPILAQPIRGGVRGLTVDPGGTPNNIVAVVADQVTVEDVNGLAYRLATVSVTPDITASGANGLDSGSVSSSITYGVYVIYNPTTNTIAGLFSASLTCAAIFAAVHMPSGYLGCALVSYLITDGSNHIRQYNQVGAAVIYKDAIQNQTNATIDTTNRSYTMTAPVGVKLEITVSGWSAPGSNSAVTYLYSPGINSPTVSGAVGPTSGGNPTPNANSIVDSPIPRQNVMTNATAQINGKATSSGLMTLFIMGFYMNFN